jgi:radical SAM superfamily enzyme YgiQ (UPF0313 family)
MVQSLILINPWIYDFAAYDLWSKPLGLLYLAGYLRESGFNIHLIDCLDIHHPEMKASAPHAHPVRRANGTGKFWREIVSKPPALKGIPRFYSRYGISRQLFVKELVKVKNPSAILVTSVMTYWYPGVKEAISLCREIHPGTPVLLGGVYARLCEDHARRVCGADEVVRGMTLKTMASMLDTLGNHGIDGAEATKSPGATPYPAFDLLHGVDYVPLLTSSGCPYRCDYCASSLLNPSFSRRDPLETLTEILYWHDEYDVRDFAFYDDALLVGFEAHAGVLFENLARLNLNLRLHAPNALHVREITADVAELLHRTGFQTIRLGLETSDMAMHQCLDGKVTHGDFERAVANLKRNHFGRNQIGAYVLAGLPDQSVESVMESIEFVAEVGAIPYLAEYSPIPHTPMWERAVACSEYDIASEPLYQNNSLLPCWSPDQRERFRALKKRVRELRSA